MSEPIGVGATHEAVPDISSMREHWASGYSDTLRMLRHPEWLARSSIKGGVAIHDLHREDPT